MNPLTILGFLLLLSCCSGAPNPEFEQQVAKCCPANSSEDFCLHFGSGICTARNWLNCDAVAAFNFTHSTSVSVSLISRETITTGWIGIGFLEHREMYGDENFGHGCAADSVMTFFPYRYENESFPIIYEEAHGNNQPFSKCDFKIGDPAPWNSTDIYFYSNAAVDRLENYTNFLAAPAVKWRAPVDRVLHLKEISEQRRKRIAALTAIAIDEEKEKSNDGAMEFWQLAIVGAAGGVMGAVIVICLGLVAMGAAKAISNAGDSAGRVGVDQPKPN